MDQGGYAIDDDLNYDGVSCESADSIPNNHITEVKYEYDTDIVEDISSDEKKKKEQNKVTFNFIRVLLE